MELNKQYTLSQKREMVGSYVHIGSFLDSSAASLCHSISRGKFGSNAVELLLELLAGITTIEEVKKDFESYKPKNRGRPRIHPLKEVNEVNEKEVNQVDENQVNLVDEQSIEINSVTEVL